MKNLWPWVPVINEGMRRVLIDAPHIIVGYSGGLDSTVLLHVLASDPLLSSKIEAVHVHHGLSVHASDWQKHCESWCHQHQVSLRVYHADLNPGPHLEERARQARYTFFESLLCDQGCLVLAHHEDDQAETLLFSLCRGTGLTGLVAMPRVRPFAQGLLLRPLLDQTKETLTQYARSHGLSWISDESNDDVSFSRNYLRHEVMPLLKRRWPSVTSAMRTASYHCEQAQSNLNDLAHLDCPDLMMGSMTLSYDLLMTLSEARLVNVLRVWLAQQGCSMPSSKVLDTMIHEVIRAKTDAHPSLIMGQHIIRRYQSTLYCYPLDAEPLPMKPLVWSSFPAPLVCDKGQWIATAAVDGIKIPLGATVEMRPRKGGERLRYQGQTKVLKKLYQARGIPPWLRDTMPLIYVDGRLAAVLDFVVSDDYTAGLGEPVYQIEYRRHVDENVG
ncbi:MAG: tRNA lysidine(34) synthetase TilS [Legionellaceae bacterium]